MAMTAREAAWTALQRWRKNGAWSDAALNIVLQNAQLAPRDAALAARICYGTLQNLTLLDHYLAAYCTTPLQKLEPKVLDLLRLSAYQIVLLDKVPPRAAVNEAVALCRKGGCARAAGLVNAVLRRVAEHRDALPEIPGAGRCWPALAFRTLHGIRRRKSPSRTPSRPLRSCGGGDIPWGSSQTRWRGSRSVWPGGAWAGSSRPS